MMNISHAEASAAILKACDANALIQGKWHTIKNGREIACLLGSVHPNINSPSDCNGDLMPLWMAELTVVLFDGIQTSEIHNTARRYGNLVARWHVLQPSDWNTVLQNFLVQTIDTAVNAARSVNIGKPYWRQISNACDLCKTAILTNNDTTDVVDAAAARTARAAARAAANAARADAYAAADAAADAAAAYAAADAARAAADAADNAADAAADAADTAARTARAAAYAADTAARIAADAPARAAADAAADAAYLKLFTFLLDQIEARF